MRRAERAVTDREKILQILDACHCCRVGFSDPDGAYIVPLSFAFVPGTPDRFYFHGAKEGRKAARIAARPKVGFELDCSYALVEGTSGCSYSCRYQSVIGTGRIGEVTDMEEKNRRSPPSWRIMNRKKASYSQTSRRSTSRCSAWTWRSLPARNEAEEEAYERF